MYFFYPNRTLVYNEHLTHLFTSLMIVVIILTLFGMSLVIIQLFVRIHLGSIAIGYHTNLSIIFFNIGIIYFLFSPSIIVIIFQFFNNWNNEESIENSLIFHMANIFRAYCLCVGAFTIPGLAMERWFATIFVEDYEIKSRVYISIFLVTIIDCVSILTTYSFIYDLCSIYLIMGIIAIPNALALILYLYSAKCNIAFYEDNLCYGSSKRYSLSKRFQVVENIKVARMIKKMFIFGWICTSILVGLFLLSFLLSFLIGESIFSNIIFVLFDLIIAIYALCIQAINYFENQVLQKELKKLFKKFNLPLLFFSFKVEPSGPHVRSVFGVELIMGEAEDETQKHFNQLHKTWN